MDLMVVIVHINPSFNPTPDLAEQGCMLHGLSRTFDNSNFSDISFIENALGKSCLFARTSNGTFVNFLSLSKLSNSIPASSILRLSEESITNIIASELSK
eukprot:232552_1